MGGLLKKTVADQMHPAVAAAFEMPERYSTMGLTVAAIAFTFQLYLDFAGYTDIALGSAWLLGFRLPQNFDWPYRATSMAEFWSRWHMTLGRWLRDYIYFPLGGSRKGNLRAYANLMITMTVAGLWHGAGLTYLVWGALQGVALCINRWWKNLPGSFLLPTLLAWGMTFAFVVFVRIFFISDSLEQSFDFLANVISFHGGRSMPLWITVGVVVGDGRAVGRVATAVPTTRARRFSPAMVRHGLLRAGHHPVRARHPAGLHLLPVLGTSP